MKTKQQDAENIQVAGEAEPNADAINLDDVEAAEADAAEDAVEDAAPAQQPTAKEKKRRRYQEAMDAAEAAAKRAEEADARSQRLEGYVRTLAERAMAQPAATQTQADPGDGELDTIYDQQMAIIARVEADKTLTRDDLKRLHDQSRKLELRKTEIVAERTARKLVGSQQQPNYLRQQMEAEYPDVYGNPRMLMWAQSYAGQKAAETNGDLTPGLIKEAFDRARLQFRTGGGPPPPTAQQRARFTSAPSRGGAASDGGGRVVVMNPVYKRMARAAFPKLPEKDAELRWAKGPGARLLGKAKEKTA